jgi:uncharacterized membrane protein
MIGPHARPSAFAIVAAVAAVTVTTMVLDLVFLGVVAKSLYDELLGPLRRPTVYWPAALAFYAMYVAALLLHAVLPSPTVALAARHGAGLGLVAYATYELTNWAVLAGWPAALVPVDVAWGVVLTAAAASTGNLAYRRFAKASP